MGTVVKLRRQRASPRPVKVYYSGPGYPGHCKTVRSAIVAATRRVLQGKSMRANIQVDGVIVADLDKLFSKVMISWRVKLVKNHELW